MRSVAHALVVVSLLTFAAPAIAQQGPGSEIAKLGWVVGPKQVQLFGRATLDIPEGFRFLDAADTEQFLEMNQNPVRTHEEKHVFAPGDLHWFSLLVFDESGYVRDDEKIDAGVLLATLKKGNEAGNAERKRRGWGELKLIGWAYPPFYDSETKRLEWATNLETENGSVINYNSRVLGRGGVTSATLVADSDGLETSVSEFKTALGQFSYIPGQKYSEFRRGDKVAEYGLTALIAGGAAAVATKTGFWKALAAFLAAGWKLVAGAVAALVAFIKRLFTKKPDTSPAR